jgi:hypothetical protein
MEEIRTSKSAELRAVKMYREDLDKLLGLIQNKCSSVTISNGKFRYQTLDEMKGHIGNNAKFFDISGEDPTVHFRTSQSEVSLWGLRVKHESSFLFTKEATESADWVFYEAKEILEKNQVPFVRWKYLVSWCLLTMLIWSAFHISHTDQYPYLFGILSGGALVLCSASLPLALIGKNEILLTRRSETPNLWARKKDDIVVNLGVALVSGLIGALLAHYLGKK